MALAVAQARAQARDLASLEDTRIADGVLWYSCPDLGQVSSGTGNNCDSNAECGNTAGSFTCSYNSGYAGTGVSCSKPEGWVLKA
eukprot:3271774-Rhodomonas_salina.2